MIGYAALLGRRTFFLSIFPPLPVHFSAWSVLKAVGGAGLLLLLVICAFLYMRLRTREEVLAARERHLYNETTARKRAQEELKAVREEPKQRVAERTAELETANVRLREQVLQRERLTAELRRSERRYRLLAETAQDIICIHDREGRILYVNPAGLIFLGYAEEEIRKQRITNFVLEEQRVALERRREQRESGNWHRFRYEMTLVNDGGDRMPVEVVSSPLVEDGEVTGVLLVIRDISEQQIRERALQASERRYRGIFENAALGIYRVTPTGRILLANPALVEMLGYDSIDVLTAHTFAGGVVSTSDWVDLKHRLERKEKITGLESVWRRKDGTPIYVRENIRVVRDDAGGVASYEGSVEDITARREAELALRESEERFRSIFDFAPLGIALVNREGRLLMINSVFQNLLGYSLPELKEMTFADFTHPDDLETDLALYQELYAGGRETYSLEKRYIHRDGHTVWVSLTVSIVRDEEGEPQHAVSMVKDISGRKQVERQAKQHAEDLESRVAERTEELHARVKQVERLNRALTNLLEDLQASHRKLEATGAQLRAANAELSEFAYVVSHDLKAPLRAIIQLSGWIQEDYAAILDADGQEMLALLVGRAHRMHDLIEGILAYSRVGRVKEREKEVDLEKLVAETISSLAPPAHIKTSTPGSLPTVCGERVRFRQVFQNLLSNAFKFMDKSEGRVVIDCRETDAYWEFSVADNGPGIAERYHDKIFQMFQTLASRDEYESTGVGLALVKKIVESWGGRIWLDSEVGQGSTFYFTLPKGGAVDAE